MKIELHCHTSAFSRCAGGSADEMMAFSTSAPLRAVTTAIAS